MSRMTNSCAWLIVLFTAAATAPSATRLLAAEAKGPLRVHPDNPRYFTDGTTTANGTLRAVYLTGSHTWTNLVDMGGDYPPEPLNYDGYLDFLTRHQHNFVRLWTWDSTFLDEGSVQRRLH